MRSTFDLSARNPVHLGKLSHETGFVLQTSGRIAEQDIDAMFLRISGTVDNCCTRIAVFSAFDDWNIQPLAPFSKLVDCSCPECICRNESSLLSLFLIHACKLGSRCRLARPIDPFQEDHRRTTLVIDWRLIRRLFIDIAHRLDNEFHRPAEGQLRVVLCIVPQLFADIVCQFNADIALQQHDGELLEEVIIDSLVVVFQLIQRTAE